MKKKILIIISIILIPFFAYAWTTTGWDTGTWQWIVSKFASGSCSGYLKSDGTCSTEAGSIAANVPIVTNSLTATGGNVTGITNLGAANLTISSTANVTGVTWTGLVPTFVDGSSSANLTVAQLSSTVIGNPTQSGNVTHTLPAIEAGLGFDAILGLTAAFVFRLDPNANDSIYLDGVSCADGKYIGLTTVTVGDAISCRAMKTGASSYDWACYTAQGAFACE
ncbi:MAG: hypothetical protein WC332_03020 [Clostridia bacterium]|jgi:hypothetical protein